MVEDEADGDGEGEESEEGGDGDEDSKPKGDSGERTGSTGGSGNKLAGILKKATILQPLERSRSSGSFGDLARALV